MRRRILCAMLALLLIVTLLPVVVGAASDPTITFVQQATAAGASEVKVDVKITNNPGFVSATIPVKWDASIMTLTNVTEVTDVVDSGWCSMSMTEYATNGTQGTYYLAWNNDTRTEADGGNFTNDGTLATLTFALVDKTVDTNTQITSELTADIANMMNFAMADLRNSGLTAVAGMVNVTAADAGGEPDPEPSDGAKLVVSSARTKAGKEIVTTISLENNPGMVNLAFDFQYDETKLEFISIEKNALFGTDMGATTFVNPYKFVFADFTLVDSTANGVLATIKFKVKDDVAVGDYNPFTISYSSGDIFNVDNDILDAQIDNGTLSVISYIAGDADGNETVNMMDAFAIAKYYARWDGYTAETVDLDAADVDGNPGVNMMDAFTIAKYYARWDGYETLPLGE